MKRNVLKFKTITLARYNCHMLQPNNNVLMCILYYMYLQLKGITDFIWFNIIM